jgi:hypothetical protein
MRGAAGLSIDRFVRPLRSTRETFGEFDETRTEQAIKGPQRP